MELGRTALAEGAHDEAHEWLTGLLPGWAGCISHDLSLLNSQKRVDSTQPVAPHASSSDSAIRPCVASSSKKSPLFCVA